MTEDDYQLDDGERTDLETADGPARLHFKNGDVKQFQNVTVKVSGWVQAHQGYEHVDNEKGGTDTHKKSCRSFPPHVLEAVEGSVTHESPHGRV